jgi:hypothetical protein
MANSILRLLFEIGEDPSKAEALLADPTYKLFQKYLTEEFATAVGRSREYAAELLARLPYEGKIQ